MSKKQKIWLGSIVTVWFFGLLIIYLHNSNFAVLNSQGIVATRERNLIIFTVILGLLVVLPVYVMTFVIAWKYRESNTKAKYQPELDRNILAESLWWGIPSAIILVLSIITWNTSHALDPHKALNVSAKPMTIQVVALDWKWLFIYPQEGIASVNEVHFPVNQPVSFEITADAPMNSFWIPQLGGQIYAMSGMSTHLNLMANKIGGYQGSSANLSGKGFAGMKFMAMATSDADFRTWLASVQHSPNKLNPVTYRQLSQPSQNNPVALYSSAEAGLYDRIVMKYMVPGGGK